MQINNFSIKSLKKNYVLIVNEVWQKKIFYKNPILQNYINKKKKYH